MTLDHYEPQLPLDLAETDPMDDDFATIDGTVQPGSIHYVNEAGVTDDIVREIRNNRDVASAIDRWQREIHQTAAPSSSLSMFDRGRWEGANHHFATMSKVAYACENDDVLSTLADVVEGAMFQKVRFELYDGDQQDFWNQWARTINLDARLREMGRELYKVSQFYVGLWWETKSYKVRDDSVRDAIKAEQDRQIEEEGGEPEVRPGNRSRRKVFSVEVPTRMTIFDPTKVVPVGTTMFGRERFAYVATKTESDAFSRVMVGQAQDRMVSELLERKYEPTGEDRAFCAQVGVDADLLWLFKDKVIFRHTLTRANYERLSPIRLKATLPILEMKEHLRNADRAALVGATNFIVLITKGSDKLPAKQAEISNLQEQAKVIARLPVLVGDHRLSVTIVAPPTDNTLIDSRYQTLDSRLVFRALGTFSPVTQGGNSAGTGLSEMSKIISRGLESRRHMLMRAIEADIFGEILERNDDLLDEFPSLAFAPRRISLDFNADVLAQVLKLRDRGDVSRETTLEELDYDQDVEVVRRARERGRYDEIFQSQTPHSSPTANPYGGQPGQPGQPQLPGQQPQRAVPGRQAQPALPQRGPTQGVGPAGQPREGGRPAGARTQRASKEAVETDVRSDEPSDDAEHEEPMT